jgi:hypothetical protein
MWVSDPSQIPGGTWGTPGSPSHMDFADAITNCASLNYAGHTDWRLPNLRELFTINDFSTFGPAINSSMFPNNEQGYWSSTTYTDPDYQDSMAWNVNFSTGDTDHNFKSFAYFYARCVRNLP